MAIFQLDFKSKHIILFSINFFNWNINATIENNLKIKSYIFLFLVIVSVNLQAQQPSHFVLGEDELSGVDIYDLHQDKYLNYWIATNNGIYKYNGYEIKKIECKGMQSSSVFNLAENAKGNIYCHNLNGQIFEVENDSCSVFYTIPDSLMNHDILIEFDDMDRFIVFTKVIFEISKDRKLNILYKDKIDSYNFVLKTKDSTLALYNHVNNSLIKIKGGKVSLEFKNLIKGYINAVFIELSNKLIAYDRRSGFIIKELSDSCNFEFPKIDGLGDFNRYYADDKGLWIANLVGGVHYYLNTTEFDKPNDLIFKSLIISAFEVDQEGNTLLGTFGKGIIVIPNKNVLDIELKLSNSDVTKITKTKGNSVILGTQKGELIKIDSSGSVLKIADKNFKRIEILEYLESQDVVLFNTASNMLIDVKTNEVTEFCEGSIKDVCVYNDENYLLATNTRLVIYNTKTNVIKNIDPYFGRTYCVGYDSVNNTVYCGTAGGLKIGTLKTSEIYKLNNQDLLCTDIDVVDNVVYVSTQKNGVLIFKNNQLIDNWTTKNGLLSNNIKQTKKYKNNFYVATDKGISVLEKTGKSIKYIDKSSGLNAVNIIDFEIVMDVIWIVTHKGVQIINLKDIINEAFIPNLNLTQVKVNNVKIDTVNHIFEYTDDVFTFEITSNSLKYRSNIYYEYQLVGVDETWIKSDFRNHIFEYKSLSPKEYVFKARSVYNDSYSETVEYTFTIEKPFWLKSGFYSILIVLFLVSMFTLLNVQIRKQKQKITIENQLNKSQLTALKSQMNPHFIFNSLNSIQDLILKQDRENAYNYISKFALLVRKILNHSDKEFIDFDEEINILKIYLELEELRFKKDFKFTIKTNDISDVEIPPILIQPFVENALKHGLLHKKGEKRLSINFYLESDILFCEIVDNGIGRQKSNEIKKRQSKAHNSFSVKSIQTRFDILKELYGENIGVNIIDMQENNESIGTKVILKIPFNKYF
jgi:ligand-binding sensor domain-containing protein